MNHYWPWVWGIIKIIVFSLGWIVVLVLVLFLVTIFYFNRATDEPTNKKDASPAYPANKNGKQNNQLPNTFSGTTAVLGVSSGTAIGFTQSVQPLSGTQTCAGILIQPPDNSMDQKQIVQDLVNQLDDIVQKHPFYSWGLMMAGVELLGTFLDEKNSFFVRDKSAVRFKDAIGKLFPKEYQQYKDRLYDELRCGVNHYTLPKQNIVLSERVYNKKNLSLDGNGNLILVAEDFFADFKTACENTMQMLDGGRIPKKIYHQLV